MADLSKTMGAEFQALPLDYLISAPLIAAVKAQGIAAAATKTFLEGMIDEESGKPLMVPFSVDQEVDGEQNSVQINAPLLSLVPVPHLRIDSITTKFHFEISQTLTDHAETSKSVTTTVKSGKLVSPWVDASLTGAISSASSHDSTTNRSGQLDITVVASESAIPEGLARVLSLLASTIQPPSKQ